MFTSYFLFKITVKLLFFSMFLTTSLYFSVSVVLYFFVLKSQFRLDRDALSGVLEWNKFKVPSCTCQGWVHPEVPEVPRCLPCPKLPQQQSIDVGGRRGVIQHDHHRRRTSSPPDDCHVGVRFNVTDDPPWQSRADDPSYGQVL